MWPCSVGCRCEARSEGAEKCFVGVRTGEAVIATTAATTTAGTAAAGAGAGAGGGGTTTTTTTTTTDRVFFPRWIFHSWPFAFRGANSR